MAIEIIDIDQCWVCRGDEPRYKVICRKVTKCRECGQKNIVDGAKYDEQGACISPTGV